MSWTGKPEFTLRGIARILLWMLYISITLSLMLVVGGTFRLLLQVSPAWQEALTVPLIVGSMGLLGIVALYIGIGCQEITRGYLPSCGWVKFWAMCLVYYGGPALLAFSWLIAILANRSPSTSSTIPPTLLDQLIGFDFTHPVFLTAATITLWSLTMTSLVLIGMFSPLRHELKPVAGAKETEVPS